VVVVVVVVVLVVVNVVLVLVRNSTTTSTRPSSSSTTCTSRRSSSGISNFRQLRGQSPVQSLINLNGAYPSIKTLGITTKAVICATSSRHS